MGTKKGRRRMGWFLSPFESKTIKVFTKVLVLDWRCKSNSNKVDIKVRLVIYALRSFHVLFKVTSEIRNLENRTSYLYNK